MKKSLLILEAGSVAELADILNRLNSKQLLQYGLVQLNIYGPDILLRQFEIANLSSKDTLKTLKIEATELILTLPQDLQLDYQEILSSAKEKKGIFIAISRNKLNEYLSLFKKYNLSTVKVTSLALANIERFFALFGKEKPNDICLMDFSIKNILNISVFHKGHCQLIREVLYEDSQEAYLEAVHSFRYALGKSRDKKFHKIYYWGEVKLLNEIIERLEEKLNIKLEHADILKANPQIDSKQNIFSLNLAKINSFSGFLKNIFINSLNIIIVILVILLIMDVDKLFRETIRLDKAKKISVVEQYDYALGLKSKLDSLQNRK